MGLGGAMWQPQGSYANKEEGVVIVIADDGGGDDSPWKRGKRKKAIPTSAEIFRDKIEAIHAEPLPAPLESLAEPILSENALPLGNFINPVDRELAKLLRLQEIRQGQEDNKQLELKREQEIAGILKARREEESELLLLYLTTL